MTAWIGQCLGGCLLEEELGHEATGMLFRGKQLALGREVAIEILPRHLPHDPAAVARFLHQARILAQLNHPNIIQVHDAGQHDDLLYLVLEYLPGPTMRTLLDLDGRLPQYRAVGYAEQVADALEAAYQECRLIHRQITPEHLVLDWRGRLKVTGFGLARAQNLPPITMGTELGGSLAYVPPEQLRGRPQDHRSDIYALGVVLYEMVTGTRPFTGHTLRDLAQAITTGRLIPPTEVVPDLSLELEYTILTALATAPDERFAHAGVMGNALRASLFHPRSHVPESAAHRASLFVEGDPSTDLEGAPLGPFPVQHSSAPPVRRHLTLPMRAPEQSRSSDLALSEEDTVKTMSLQPGVSGRQAGKRGNLEQLA